MKEIKRCFVDFAFYDRSRIQKYLEKKSENGWLLEKIIGYIWMFKKVEPKNRVFSVVYFAKASEFDPEPSEEQLLYQDFCEHTGWKLATTNAQMHIFYCEEKNPVPIETDAELEVETIHKAAKKSYLTPYAVTLGCLIFQAIMFIGRFLQNPLKMLSNTVGLLWGACELVGILVVLMAICGYYRWYRKARKQAKEGGSFLQTKGGRNRTCFLVIWFLLSLVLWISSYNEYMPALLVVFACLGVVTVTLLVVFLVEGLRVLKVSAQKNRNIMIVSTIGLSLILGFCIIVGQIFVNTYVISEKVPVATYEYRDLTWDIFEDEIPLTIEDIMPIGEEQYTYEMREYSESPLVSYQKAFQRPRVDEIGQYPDLYYTVVDVKCKPFYKYCLTCVKKLIEKEYGYRSEKGEPDVAYESIDINGWGAKEAFQIVYAGETTNQYLLCYEHVIVNLEFKKDCELTDAMKGIIGEKLGGR